MHTNTNTIKTTPHNAVTNTYSDPSVEFSYQAGKVVIKQKKQSYNGKGSRLFSATKQGISRAL